MKTKLLFLTITLFVGSLHINAQITLSHHVDPVTIDTEGLSCGSSTNYADNHFARVYNLNEFNITEDFVISALEFGQANADDGKTVILNVYTSNSEFLPTATLTLVSTTETSLLASNNFSLISVSIEAVIIPAGSIIVVETFAPQHSTQYYSPGFNLTGHNDTAWVKVPSCGLTNWIDANNSGVGDEQHILINIVGTENLGVEDFFIKTTSIYPNPTTGNFTISLANRYDVVSVAVTNIIGQHISISTVKNTDKLSLSIEGEAGIYFVTLSSSEGNSKTIKIIKKG